MQNQTRTFEIFKMSTVKCHLYLILQIINRKKDSSNYNKHFCILKVVVTNFKLLFYVDYMKYNELYNT